MLEYNETFRRNAQSGCGSATLSGAPGFHEEEARCTPERGIYPREPFVEMDLCASCGSHACQVGCCIHLLQGRLHRRVLEITPLRELKNASRSMPLRYIHTESSPAWYNKLRFLFTITNESAVLSHRSAHLLDDILGYASDADSFVATLNAVFGICLEKGLNLNPLKCDPPLMSCSAAESSIPRVSRFIPGSTKVWRQWSLQLLLMHFRSSFICANWMRTDIVTFSDLKKPLHNLLESQYSMHKTRLKSKIDHRPLSAWWDEHKAVFTPSLRRSLIKSIWQLLALRSAYAFSRLRLRRIWLA